MQVRARVMLLLCLVSLFAVVVVDSKRQRKSHHITQSTPQNAQYQKMGIQLFNFISKEQAILEGNTEYRIVEKIDEKNLQISKRETAKSSLKSDLLDAENMLFDIQKTEQATEKQQSGATNHIKRKKSHTRNSSKQSNLVQKQTRVLTKGKTAQKQLTLKHHSLALKRVDENARPRGNAQEDIYYDQYYRHRRSRDNVNKRGDHHNDRGSNKIFLYNNFNEYYTTRIAISKQVQHFDLILSTGLALSYLESYYCSSKACNSYNYYDYQASQKVQTLTMRQQVETGIPGVEGFHIQDTLYLNDLLGIKSTNMIEVTKWDGHLLNKGEYDGVLGLGIDKQIDSLINKLINQRQIRRPMFSVYQNRMYMNKQSDPVHSHIIFGAYDRSLTSGREPVWYPVVEDKYWTIQFQRILLDGVDTNLCSVFKQCKMGFDSFHTTLLAPNEHLQHLLKNIGLQGRRCQHYYRLPVITFVINGEKYPLYPEQYMITMTRYGMDPLYEHSDEKDIVDCVLNIVPTHPSQSANQVHWIMGNIFTSRYYMVFEKYYYNDQYVALAPTKFLKNKRS